MTPKEKALELIEGTSKNISKKMVNELINETSFYKDSSPRTSKGRLIFWKKVLKQIDKI